MKVLIFITQAVMLIIMVLLSVAFFSLLERKLMGLIQFRKGPSKVFIMGLLQPISDAMKLLTKSFMAPVSSPSLIYYTIPIVFMIMSLCYWLPLPIKGNWLIVQSGMLFIMFCMSMSVYMIIFLGWFSNSKYSLIGSIRSLIQTISYEIVLSFIMFCMCMLSNSINISDILMYQNMSWFILPLLPMIIPMVVSMLVETNRAPFDLTEGESELVSGFCVEYGSLSYTLVFLSENASVIFMSVLLSILMTKFSMMMVFIMLISFVWIRATMPRVRFDKLMNICWVSILPFVITMLMIIVFLM